MEVKVGPTEGGRTTLTVTGNAERVDAAYRRVLRELRREVHLPGFRRGRAPEQLISSVIGPEQFQERIGQSLIEETLTEALAATSWVPLERPTFETLRCERGEPFEYQLTGPLAQVELPDVSQIQVRRFQTTVTPEMAAERFDAERERQARFRMSEHNVVQQGDTVNLALRVSYQGKVIDQYGPPRVLRIDVGQNRLRLPLENHLLGMGREQEKVVLVTCPPDYPQEEVRNQQVECYIQVLDILEKILPDEDEFALSWGDYANAEEARQGILQNLQSYYDAFAQSQAENALMDQVIAQSTIEIPENFLKERIEDEWEELQAEAEEHREDQRPSEEELRQQAEEQVTRALQSEAILQRIAIEHHLRPKQEDLAEEIGVMAQANNVPVETLIERLSENQQMPEVRERVRLRLAMQKLMDLAQVQEVPVPATSSLDRVEAAKDEEADAN